MSWEEIEPILDDELERRELSYRFTNEGCHFT